MQIVDAIEHLHTNGVIHRDLNPKNIFLCFPEQDLEYLDLRLCKVKIIDFNISKLVKQKNLFSQSATILYETEEEQHI